MSDSLLIDLALPDEAVAIAVEPMVGCRIREQRNLHVLHAAVAANNTLAFMQWYNKFGESSSLGTATEKADYTTRYRPECIQDMTVKYLNPNSKRLAKGEGAVPPWVQQMKDSGRLKRLSVELAKS